MNGSVCAYMMLRVMCINLWLCGQIWSVIPWSHTHTIIYVSSCTLESSSTYTFFNFLSSSQVSNFLQQLFVTQWRRNCNQKEKKKRTIYLSLINFFRCITGVFNLSLLLTFLACPTLQWKLGQNKTQNSCSTLVYCCCFLQAETAALALMVLRVRFWGVEGWHTARNIQ